LSDAFWEVKPLSEMTDEEWESLCDGCGKCCLHKLEDEETGKVYYTGVACQLLDTEQCCCGDYANRLSRVPDCIKLSPQRMEDFKWLPNTCAYRLVARGEPLPDWHPLVTGDSETVHRAEMSVSGRVISEAEVDLDLLEEHIVRWIV